MKSHIQPTSNHFQYFNKSALSALELLERQRQTLRGRLFVKSGAVDKVRRLRLQAEASLAKGNEDDAVARWNSCVSLAVEILVQSRKSPLGKLLLSKRRLVEARKIQSEYKKHVGGWKRERQFIRREEKAKTAPFRTRQFFRTTANSGVRIVVLLESLSERMALNGRAWPSIVFLHPDHYTPEKGDLVCWPVGEFSLRECELRSVLLAAALKEYDFILLAHGVQNLDGDLRIGPLRDVLFVSASHWNGYRTRGELTGGLTGRVLRSFLPNQRSSGGMVPLDVAFGKRVSMTHHEITIGQSAASVPARPHLDLRLLPLSGRSAQSDRKTIFILPAVFAVGGVERNTVEVMRQLQNEFRFVLISNETHGQTQGVSHPQLDGIVDSVYDLAEVGETGRHLELIGALNRAYQPALVYICNGSTWLADNAMRIREVFANVPIVDQQVYDTAEGWIACYQDPAKRPYDHFIATNQKIKDAFDQQYKIDPVNISLIYSCIDPTKIVRKSSHLSERAVELKRMLRLREGAKSFGFIGRLVDQKQPLAFLELALRAQQGALSDCFVLVGSGMLKRQCEEYVNANGLENVRMLDHCDQTSDLYEILDGLIVTSAYEGLPIVSIEAMAAGLPVLATDVGDIALTFQRHHLGSMFSRPGDPDSMYADFKRWRDEGVAHSANARAGVEGVRSFFSSVAAAERYKKCWNNLIDEWGRKRHNSKRRISVVIPTFNRAVQLEQTVYRCVECAGGVELEFVIVDDGSKDNTATRLESMAQKVPNLKYIQVENGGPGRARNIGAANSSHPVVLFLGDDILPKNPDFFRVHAELHAANPSQLFGVLGKVGWPSDPRFPINFVMAHIQGDGGEQFGYRQLRGFSEVDWRYFYTSNVSLKRDVVSDWHAEGFSSSFSMAAFEDCELAYRLSKKGFKLYYDPTSEGEHAHHYSAKAFLGRQMTCGMMSVIFLKSHPEVAEALGLSELRLALRSEPASGDISDLPHYLSVLEGIKSLVCLLEHQPDWGAYPWHADFLSAVFEVAYLQGHVAGETDPGQNQVAAYQAILKIFWMRMAKSFHQEAVCEVFQKFAGV